VKLERLVALARPADGDDGPWFALDGDDDVMGLVAWFGENDAAGTRITARGEDAGYLARTDLYTALAGKTLGFGDALRWTLPGTPGTWRPYELHCPVGGCGPHYVVRFDPAKPPQCPRHRRALSLDA
jgi:hypothetical protein